MTKFYAFYLPQYHPIKENDEWYGKGFTEWRSVVSAKPLYRGHYQPHIPGELGFYDLRLRETLVEQINLAKEYGVDGFCFWHYWFGMGKQLLETPFQKLLKDTSLDIKFALAWGNASWTKKQWGAEDQDRILMEQQYLGEEDYTAHFYSLLDAFRDERYIKIEGKPIFIVYKPFDSPEIPSMMKLWRSLALKEGLSGIYFIAHDFVSRDQRRLLQIGFDGIYNDNMLNIYRCFPKLFKGIAFIAKKIGIPTVFKYKKAVEYMITDDEKKDNIYPCIVPNWDHTPRSGVETVMFSDCCPKYFKVLVKNALNVIKDKPVDNQVVFIKSWNEWAEGNYMEPDLKYGRGYLEALKSSREEFEQSNVR